MAFTSIIAPIIIIGLVFVTFGDIIIKIITMFPKLLRMVKSITDPEVFLRDLSFGLIKGIQMIMMSLKDMIEGIVRMVFKKLNISDDILGNKNKDNNQAYNKVKCVKPTFLKYVILVVCPPLYVFMNKGFSGWLYILFDILFTCMFYFPGLIYAWLICENC